MKFKSFSKKELINRISGFIENTQSDSFEDLALEVFRFQFETIEPLKAYWESLGANPESVRTSTDIPPVSLAVFKHNFLFSGDQPIKTFRTSGTSGKGRGSSPFDEDDLALMDVSIMTNAAANLFNDSTKSRFFMLVPSPDEAPEVIMANGMHKIADHFGTGEPFYAVRGGKFVGKEAIDLLVQWASENVPVTLIGGSFGFVNFVEGVQEKIKQIKLPEGSRMLDAGGFKGRSRELDRNGFLKMMQSFFGLPEAKCFNLYGLTETASQFYSCAREPKKPPHWTKVRICDPLTLQDVAVGEQGVPVLYDLANVARPAVILTDDIGVSFGEEGFDVSGRASGSAPRGCSLSLEEVR